MEVKELYYYSCERMSLLHFERIIPVEHKCKLNIEQKSCKQCFCWSIITLFDFGYLVDQFAFDWTVDRKLDFFDTGQQLNLDNFYIRLRDFIQPKNCEILN